MEGGAESFAAGMRDGGLSFRFSTHGGLDHIANLVQRDGLENYEAPFPGIFVALCREQSGTVLDVGANTGLFTLLAAVANPAAQVCAFEPLPSVRTLLHANIALNPALATRISVQPFGLSQTSGTFTFYETINEYGLVPTSSSLELTHVEEIGNFREQQIETRTLDEWSRRLGLAKVHFMKVDVEGHEHAVIAGGRVFLAEHRPYLTLEVLGSADTGTLNSLLRESEYLDFAMAPTGLRNCETVRHHSDAWNHLLCPAERAGRLLQICRRLGLPVTLG